MEAIHPQRSITVLGKFGDECAPRLGRLFRFFAHLQPEFLSPNFLIPRDQIFRLEGLQFPEVSVLGAIRLLVKSKPKSD